MVGYDNRLIGLSTDSRIAYDQALPQDDTWRESYIWDLSAREGTVVCARNDGRITLHSAKNGELMASHRAGDRQVVAADFSPDGRLIACAVGWDTVFLTARTGGVDGAILRSGENVRALTFSPSGRYVATASDDHMVRVFTAPHGQKIFEHRVGAFATCVAFASPTQLVVGSSGNGLHVFTWSPDAVHLDRH
jgi:WD40 repeat protein